MKNIFEPFPEETALKVTKEQAVKALKSFDPERYNMLLCPECKGNGKVIIGSEIVEVCARCGGFGWIKEGESNPPERRQRDNNRTGKEGAIMNYSILEDRRILVVDEDPDVLEVLEEEILGACPGCKIDKVTAYREAVEKMIVQSYDAVIFDFFGIQCIDLLELAQSRHFPVGLLITYPVTPETLRRSTRVAPLACLPKEMLGDVVPFLEKILNHRHESLFSFESQPKKLRKTFGKKNYSIPKTELESKTGSYYAGAYCR